MNKFGEEAAKIKAIIDECLKPEDSRPEMRIVLDILNKPSNMHQQEIEFHNVLAGRGQTGKS